MSLGATATKLSERALQPPFILASSDDAAWQFANALSTIASAWPSKPSSSLPVRVLAHVTAAATRTRQPSSPAIANAA